LNNPSTHGARDPGLVTFLWWLTTLGWAGLIFYFSTSTFSGEFTVWLLRQVLDFLHISVLPATFYLLNYLIRKLAHLTEYAMFSFLLYGGLSGGKPFAWRARTAGWCIVIAGIYSLTDEFHQAFVPGRAASWTDCGIDAAGAALAMLFLFADKWYLQAKARRRAARKDSPADT
jgi:VanZ family protein